LSASIGAAWRAVRDRFRLAGLETPELDARLLAEAAFGLAGLDLVARERDSAPADAIQRLGDFAGRRLAGEPVARILGEREFWGLRFSLNRATLEPRPETELLVARGIELLAAAAQPSILDLGTGTACIPIALLHELPAARATAVDLSAEALVAAAGNARRHAVADRLTLLQGSWFAPLPPAARFDLIVSNPPYIESAEIPGLAPEVREHDPRLALDGGADGLDAYRAIAAGAGAHLVPGGTLLLEIGSTQAEAASAILDTRGLTVTGIVPDLAGHPRMIVANLR
jgi:release factor glutamine methyltransferase